MSYRFVPPRSELPQRWLAELGDTIAAREDIAAVYFLTRLYETEEGGVIAQDEIHVELVKPPEYAAEPEQFRAYAEVLPANGPSWTIAPTRILATVREVGLRIA